MIFGSFAYRTLITASDEASVISSPEELGTVFSWIRGDEATMERSGSHVYTSLTDMGTLGNTWNAATNAHPVAVDIAGVSAIAFRGSRTVSSVLAASNWTPIHDGTSDHTLSFRFYIYQLGTTQWIFSTSQSGNNVGIRFTVNSSSNLVWRVNNGSTNFQAVSVGDVQLGWNTAQITKSGANHALSLNNETFVPITVTSPSSADPEITAFLGNAPTGGVSLNGLVSECVIHDGILDSFGLSQMRDYFDAEWNAEPSYSPLSEPVDTVCWYRMDQAVSDSPPNTTVYDESGYNNHLTGTATIVDPWDNTGHPAVRSNGTSYRLISANFTQGTIAQPITHYLVVNGINIAGWVDGRVTGSRNYIFYNGGSTVSLQAPTVVSSGASWVSGLHLGLVRVVFDGAATKVRTKQRANVESMVTVPSSPGTHSLTGVCMLSNVFNAAWMGVNEGIGEHIVFAGVAGSDTTINDQNSVYLLEKYNIEPVLLDASFDDPDATITSGNFDALPNRGYYGGNLTSSGLDRPTTTTQNGHVAGLKTSTQRLTSSIVASTYNRLHNGFGAHTISVVIVPGTLNSENAILATYNGTNTNRGFRLRATSAGAIQVLVANGTVNTTISSADSIYQTGVPCIIHVTIQGSDYEIFSHGISVATGNVASPSTVNATSQLALGEVNSSATGAAGTYCAAFIIDKVLTDSEIVTDAAILAAKWIP